MKHSSDHIIREHSIGAQHSAVLGHSLHISHRVSRASLCLHQKRGHLPFSASISCPFAARLLHHGSGIGAWTMALLE